MTSREQFTIWHMMCKVTRVSPCGSVTDYSVVTLQWTDVSQSETRGSLIIRICHYATRISWLDVTHTFYSAGILLDVV